MTRLATRVTRHVRANVIAYLALCCSLAGTSYAALSLPRNSVGAAQLRNRAITPVKFNPAVIGGSIRDWAIVAASGKVMASSSRVVEREGAEGALDTYVLGFAHHFTSRCLALTTAQPSSTAQSTPPPQAGALANATLGPPDGVIVKTFNGQGSPTLAGFYIAIVC